MADHPMDVVTTTNKLHLLVASDDQAILEAVRVFVEGASRPVTVSRCLEVGAALEQDESAPVLVPVWLPLDHVRNALQAGKMPGIALATWVDQMESLLRTCRKARRRIVMIDAGMFTAHPAAFSEALGARLDLKLGGAGEAEAVTRSEPASIHYAIAAAQLATDSRALKLADEIEAMCIGPVGLHTLSSDDIAAAAKSAANLIEERDLLRESLRQMVAETENMVAEMPRDAEEHSLKAQLNDMKRQLDEARDQIAELLVADRSHDAEKHSLKAQLDDMKRQLDEARDQIALIYDSTSWKVTGPIRSVRRLLGPT